jgi:hypothetical protein
MVFAPEKAVPALLDDAELVVQHQPKVDRQKAREHPKERGWAACQNQVEQKPH